MKQYTLAEVIRGEDPLRKISNERDEVEDQGWHRHQCDSCGIVWKHENKVMFSGKLSEEEYHQGHNCPLCGENQRWRYASPAMLLKALLEQMLGVR